MISSASEARMSSGEIAIKVVDKHDVRHQTYCTKRARHALHVTRPDISNVSDPQLDVALAIGDDAIWDQAW